MTKSKVWIPTEVLEFRGAGVGKNNGVNFLRFKLAGVLGEPIFFYVVPRHPVGEGYLKLIFESLINKTPLEAQLYWFDENDTVVFVQVGAIRKSK